MESDHNIAIETRNSFSSLSFEDEMFEQESKTDAREEYDINVKEDTTRPVKRARDEDDGEENEEKWEIAGGLRKEKKSKSEFQMIEMYISSKELMPKQFALAKTLTKFGISDVEKVKYINPYKVRLDIVNECSAIKLENCTELSKMGWRMQRVMENSHSYGVIKNVDINMTDEEIIKGITNTEKGELDGVYRLKRRIPGREGWYSSEAVRLCFKGSYLPPFIYVEGLRIKVHPYIFPVSQCSRCWKLGHNTKKCPSSRIVCPKCGENHANCDTKSYKCVNCNGRHMAMSRASCPTYLKEKRLRELMSEYNCTYRRALTMYVPMKYSEDVSTSISATKLEPESHISKLSVMSGSQSNVTESQLPTFAQITSTTQVDIHKDRKKATPRSHKKHQQERPFDVEMNCITEAIQEEESSNQSRPQVNKEREVKFSELLNRLKEIIFFKRASFPMKVQSVIKCCIEWFILLVVDNISDWPILKTILDLFGP